MNPSETVQIDHAAYQKKIKRFTIAELQFTANDAGEAMKANPTGPKAGYYADEQHYCWMEIATRRSGNRRRNMAITKACATCDACGQLFSKGEERFEIKIQGISEPESTVCRQCYGSHERGIL